MLEGVRPATPDDADRCRELLAAARRAAASKRGGEQLAALATGMDEAEADERHVLLGTFDGAVVGIGVAHLGPQRTGRLDCCYVEPGARGVGVGGALVDGLLRWLAARGCTGVDAPALPGDRATKQLLEGAGFKARLLVLHRRLA